MIELEDLYFEWLLSCIEPDGLSEGVAHVCGLLHNCEFRRRVGHDINRAIDGLDLRKEFIKQFEELSFDPRELENLMQSSCTWLEMLIALSRQLDYLYEGGVDGRFIELINNMDLGKLAGFNPRRSKATMLSDRKVVYTTTSNIDDNLFNRDGVGGIFPLHESGNIDQRKVELWDQHAAYFRERLEGVLWTSTN